MGFGLGAAIGARIGQKSAPVLLVTGDGSFRMNHLELLTASKYGIPLTIVVFNNHSLGMVRQWQGIFNDQRYAHTDVYDPLDLETLCRAYNVDYMGRFGSPVELRELLAANPFADRIRVIEYVLDNNHWVYPMVAAGSSINDILERSAQEL